MESIKISETDLIRILTDREHMLRQIKELQERGSRFVLENRRLKQQLISNNIEVPVDIDEVAAVNHLPKRKCKVCGGRITLDQEYFDGGIRNRTHIECANRIHIVEHNVSSGTKR